MKKRITLIAAMLFGVIFSSHSLAQAGGWYSVDQIDAGWNAAVSLSIITDDGASGAGSSLNIHVEATADQSGTVIVDIRKDASPVAVPIAAGAYIRWMSGNSDGHTVFYLSLNSASEFLSVSGRDTFNIPYNINTWMHILTHVDASALAQVDGVSLILHRSGLQPGQQISFDVRMDNVHFQYNHAGNDVLWDGMGDPTMDVPEEYVELKNFRLSQNYPNPFNPATIIPYHISSPEKVKLEIFTIGGELVKTLVDAEMPAGDHKVTFDALGLSSGIYLYRLRVGEFVQMKKMNLLK